MSKKQEFTACCVCDVESVRRLLQGGMADHAGLFPAIAKVHTKQFRYSFDGTHGEVEAAPFVYSIKKTANGLFAVEITGGYISLLILSRFTGLRNIRKEKSESTNQIVKP